MIVKVLIVVTFIVALRRAVEQGLPPSPGAGRLPDSHGLQLTLAREAVRAIYHFGEHERWDEMAAALGEGEDLGR